MLVYQKRCFFLSDFQKTVTIIVTHRLPSPLNPLAVAGIHKHEGQLNEVIHCSFIAWTLQLEAVEWKIRDFRWTPKGNPLFFLFNSLLRHCIALAIALNWKRRSEPQQNQRPWKLEIMQRFLRSWLKLLPTLVLLSLYIDLSHIHREVYRAKHTFLNSNDFQPLKYYKSLMLSVVI